MNPKLLTVLAGSVALFPRTDAVPQGSVSTALHGVLPDMAHHPVPSDMLKFFAMEPEVPLLSHAIKPRPKNNNPSVFFSDALRNQVNSENL